MEDKVYIDTVTKTIIEELAAGIVENIRIHLSDSLDRVLGESLKRISDEMNTGLKHETKEVLREIGASIVESNGAIMDGIVDLAARHDPEPALSAELLKELDSIKAGNKEIRDANISILDTFNQIKDMATVDSTKYKEQASRLKAMLSAAETEKEKEISDYREAVEKVGASKNQLLLQIDALKGELETIANENSELAKENETFKADVDGKYAILSESVDVAEQAIRERDQMRQKLDDIQSLWDKQAAGSSQHR